VDKTKDIKTFLNGCTISNASGCPEGTGLSDIHKRIFDHRKNIPKAQMAEDLAAFYAEAGNIIDIWNSLTECEKDFVTYIVQYGGKEYIPTTVEYAEKHGIELEYTTRWGGKESFLRGYRYHYLKFLPILKNKLPDTKTHMLFPGGKEMPGFILNVLKNVVEPMKYEYNEYLPDKRDYIICRESRLGDFAAVVRFAGRERLKVKPGTFDITKAKLAKLSETAGFDEVCDKDGKFCTPKETERNNDFKVALPLFTLAANSGLVESNYHGDVSPSKKSVEILSMPRGELARKLFYDYLNSDKIHELHYITYINAYDGNHWVNWPECRKPIINLLKTCPGEKFIKFEVLDKYAKILCGNFFRRLLNCAVMVRGYDFGYDHYGNYELDWNECESQIIRLILSFLSAVGMVDIAYTENVPRIRYANDDFCVGIAGFRITKLGMWILGMSDTYDEPEEASGSADEGRLLVQPDYSVIISGLKCRIEHETYLSKFLTKVSDDENAAIYRLDIQSAIKAYNEGITPRQIKIYLKKSGSEHLPGNVERSLDDWQAKVGKIKIRKLTILETDDPLLLEEIKHIKGMDGIISDDIKNAAEIDGNQTKKAKTLIEKNGWFVRH